MMRAIVQRAYGTADVLELRDIAEPTPGPHDVLVAVHAASVNHGDCFVTCGRPYLIRAAMGLRRPRVAVRGRDLSGRVEAVGAAVTRFRPGDDVYAETTTGSFAEYACVPERLLAPKPANLTFEQAAAVPLAAVTALQGLRDVGQVQPGQAVLINGASGGVGTFAVQIAKALDADVTGVCSTRNVELVRSLGADHVIDYTREDFTRSGQRYDVILDLAGRHPLTACRGALTRAGVLVLASGHGGPVLGPLGRYARALAWSPFVTQRLRVHAAKPSQSDLDAVTALIEAGAVTPAIEATYELADTPAAIRHLAEAHARAKNVIAVRGSHAAPQPSTKETEMPDLHTEHADPAQTEPILSARGVTKTYRTGTHEVHALRGVDLDVRPGELVMVMGPSGNGKTTLLNCLSGLDDIDAGTVTVDGADLFAMSDADRTRHRAERMGFIFQSFNLIPVLSAAENVELPLLVTGVAPKLARAQAKEMLARVGLADRAGHRPGELSGGEQQRVTVARALVAEPALVWADEPTGALDSRTAGEIIELLHEVHAAGQTLVVVTHDEALGHSGQRLVEVRDGRVGNGSELLTAVTS